jgi:molybdopterin molybdotransferase
VKKLESLNFYDAIELAMQKTVFPNNTEIVMIDNALNRVLACDVICQKNLPSFDNSAMDGFAFKYEDIGKTVKIISTIYTGDTPTESLIKHSCYKIMTGAKVPSDADTIVPIEDCPDIKEKEVTLPTNIKKGNALRKKGEEQAKGTLLLKKGERLSPAHISMLSAQGIVAFEVYKPLSIAVVSTGNEIKEPWHKSSEDEIYNSNALE